jgi:hypothetical protein
MKRIPGLINDLVSCNLVPLFGNKDAIWTHYYEITPAIIWGDGHASVDDVPDGRVQDWDGYILGVPALYHGLDSKQGEGLQGALERAHKEYRPSYREHLHHWIVHL